MTHQERAIHITNKRLANPTREDKRQAELTRMLTRSLVCFNRGSKKELTDDSPGAD